MSWSIARLYCCALLIISGLSASAEALQYQDIGPGLEYGILSPDLAHFKLHVLRVDLKKNQIKPILASTFHRSALSAKEMAEKTQAVAVINASFFKNNKAAIGLILSEGKLIQAPVQQGWWASFLIKNNQAFIRKRINPARLKQYEMGIQAGPRLVINQKPPRLKKEYSQKSALGVDAKGRLLIIASEGSIEINELARLMAQAVSQGGIGVINGLNLDGGKSSQFFLKSVTPQVWLPGFIRVPVGLGIFPK